MGKTETENRAANVCPWKCTTSQGKARAQGNIIETYVYSLLCTNTGFRTSPVYFNPQKDI